MDFGSVRARPRPVARTHRQSPLRRGARSSAPDPSARRVDPTANPRQRVLQEVIHDLLQPMAERTAVAEEALKRLLSIEELDAADRLAEHVSRCADARLDEGESS